MMYEPLKFDCTQTMQKSQSNIFVAQHEEVSEQQRKINK